MRAGALACLPVMGPLYMAWAGLQVAAGVADLIGTGLTVRRQLAFCMSRWCGARARLAACLLARLLHLIVLMGCGGMHGLPPPFYNPPISK